MPARRHGQSQTDIYRIWRHIKERCFNPSTEYYYLYGGRGITMCQRWKSSFEAFRDDMGPRPSPTYSIDRFPDKNGHYEPGNCRWATQVEQSRNKRNNRYYQFEGEAAILTDHARRLGIDVTTLVYRLDNWPEDKALSIPKTDQFHSERSIRLTFEGRTLTLRQWAELRGWPLNVVRLRYKQHWSVERLLTQPPQRKMSRNAEIQAAKEKI